MPRKKENPVVEDYSMYVFELPLTVEEKKTIIDILWKDFEWNADYSSFQIKTFDEDFDKKIEEEILLRETARTVAKKGLLDAITLALAVTWNRRDDFNAIRKIIRKYAWDEYAYYRERNGDISRFVNLLSRVKLTQNYLRPRIGDKKIKVMIDGACYTIRERRWVELAKLYNDKEKLREAVLKEAVPYKETPAVEL
ncbi:MAG: hypothetical protein J6T63_01760 [Bacteroidales bacterium]|nr:hypothetical protein [Bacteroidales bacterium]